MEPTSTRRDATPWNSDGPPRIGVMMHVTNSTASCAQLAMEAESRGFEAIFVTEHTHIPVRDRIAWRDGQPMPEHYKHLHDPIVALAAAASVTSTIKLGTGVLVLGQREPIATAKQLATLDRISNGRFVCGVGFGWEQRELAHHGVAWDERQEVLWEHLAAIRTLWTAEEPDFEGARVRFGPSWSYPKPVRPSGPPVVLGAGGSIRNLRDIARHADGWMPIEGTENIAGRWGRLRQISEEHGRDPDTLELTVFGSAGDRAAVEAHGATGASRVVVEVEGGDLDSVRRQLDRHTRLLHPAT